MTTYDEAWISSNVWSNGRLDLSYKNLGVDEAKRVAKSLANNNTVKILHIHNNSIGDGGAKALAESLVTNRTVTYLYLTNNSIGDDGAKALAKLIVTNRTVRVLNLSDNSIGDDGAKALLASLDANNTLMRMGLDGNNVSDELENAIDAALAEDKRKARQKKLEALQQEKEAPNEKAVQNEKAAHDIVIREKTWYKEWRHSVFNNIGQCFNWDAKRIYLIGIKGKSKNIATAGEWTALQEDIREGFDRETPPLNIGEFDAVSELRIHVDELEENLAKAQGSAYVIVCSCPEMYFDQATEIMKKQMNNHIFQSWGRKEDASSGMERDN